MRVTRRGAVAVGVALAIGMPTAGCSAGNGAPGSARASASAEQAPRSGQLPPDLRAAGAVVLSAYQAGRKPGSGERSFTYGTIVFGPRTITTLFTAATGANVYTYYVDSGSNSKPSVDTLAGFGAEVQGPAIDDPSGSVIIPDVAVFAKYDQRDRKWQTTGIHVTETADHQIRTGEIIVNGTGSGCYGERTVAPDESYAPVCDRPFSAAQAGKALTGLLTEMEAIATLRPGSDLSQEPAFPVLP